MKRKPKHVTPLRQVRIASGLNQKQFAALVGIKYDLYQSLELGRAALTEENADKVLRTTGAQPRSLDPKQSDIAMSFEDPRKPYSKQSWLDWEREGRASMEREVSRLTPALIGWTQLVCLAALQHGKFWDVHNYLAKALADCAAKCGLNMRKILSQELGYARQRLSYTYGELRENPELARAVGFKDRSSVGGRIHANDDVWRTSIPLADLISWDPSSQMPMCLLAKLARKFPSHKAGQYFSTGRS